RVFPRAGPRLTIGVKETDHCAAVMIASPLLDTRVIDEFMVSPSREAAARRAAEINPVRSGGSRTAAPSRTWWPPHRARYFIGTFPAPRVSGQRRWLFCPSPPIIQVPPSPAFGLPRPSMSHFPSGDTPRGAG